jgi:hypothetical protein
LQQIQVALEIGKKRIFASALDWPGWARSGRNEAEALGTLLAYGPRYQGVVSSTRLNFELPAGPASFKVMERLKGNATTDFGAPGVAPSADTAALDAAALQRSNSILGACWKFFGLTVAPAGGKTLRKGPRGGGRTLDQIIDHVIESHFGYLRKINWRGTYEKNSEISSVIEAIVHDDAQALELAISGEMPETGPRGGKLWKPRYFVRRAAWHILDHAWEIEDRLEP